MATHEKPLERTGDAPMVPVIVPSLVTRFTWILAIVAGLVAGVGSWLAIEAVLSAHRDQFIPLARTYPSEEDMAKILRARIMSGTFTHGAMGVLFGLALGLAGGLSRRSVAGALLGAGVGVIVGGLVEGGVARLVMDLLYTNLDPSSGDLLMPLLGHLSVWALAGLVGGLAFGLGLGGKFRWVRTAVGGAVGAGLATALFEVIGALGFATSGTALPIPESVTTRALAMILVGLGAAIGSVLAAKDPQPRKPKVSSTSAALT